VKNPSSTPKIFEKKRKVNLDYDEIETPRLKKKRERRDRHTNIGFSTCLKKLDSIFISQRLALILTNNLTITQNYT
jgi:hypothetical protein